MRRRYLIILGGALFLLGPAAAAGQTEDRGCDFPASGTIDAQDWSDIQSHLQHLDDIGAFDTNPFVSDRQSLVKKVSGGKQARSMALVAGRPVVDTAPPQEIEDGCFVGMIDSERAESAVGAFEGKTFVWVDAQGPGGSWRTIQFPLDGESKLDAAALIGLPYLTADPTGRREGGFTPSDVHLVYRGTLIRASLGGYDFAGARWMIQSPLAPAADPDTGFIGYLSTLSLAPDMEVMACYRCDGTTCCPQTLKLSVF